MQNRLFSGEILLKEGRELNNTDIKTLGDNIKATRESRGMTQKGLAEVLSVTPQAVSRWENNIAEPDVNTIKEIAAILGVMVSKLLGEEPPAQFVTEQKESPQIIAEAEDPIFGQCVKCQRDVRESNIGRKMSLPKTVSSGRTHRHVPSHPELVCRDCVNKEKELRRQGQLSEVRSTRRRGLTHATIWSLVFLGLGLWFIFSGNQSIQQLLGQPLINVLVLLVLTYLVFATIFVIIADNSFVGNMMGEIFAWGFVRMPGLIFSLDLDGIIWFLTVKLAFFILGFIIALAAGALALGLGLPLSGIIFPFAIKKSFNEEKQIALGGKI